MEYKCIMWGIGHGQAKNIYKPGQPLYGWTIDLDTSVKPETYERASVVLTEYSNNAEFIENPFTPDENHSRYGLPDDHFWIQKKHIWEILKMCYDPEIPVNIVDLGLVYDLKSEKLKSGKIY